MTEVNSDETDGMVTAVKLAFIDSKVVLLSSFESGKLLLGKLVDKKFQILSKFQFSVDDLVPLAIDFDADRSMAVVAGSSDKIFVLKFESDAETFTVLTERKIPTKGISNLKIRSCDKKILICGGWDSTVKLFSWLKPERLKPLGALKFHSEAVEAVCCTERPVEVGRLKGHLFAAASKDEKVSVWSVYNDV